MLLSIIQFLKTGDVMPSVGMAMAMVISARIDSGIRSAFETDDERRDAHRIVDLGFRSGFGAADIALVILAATVPLILGILIFPFGLISFLVPVISHKLIKRRIVKAQNEMSALINSNPVYWNPILEKVKEIVLKAGVNEGGFGPPQMTRVVGTTFTQS